MRQLTRREVEPSMLDSLFRRLRDLAGRGEPDNGGLREALEELIEDAEEAGPEDFSTEQRTLVLNALAFGQLRVDDVMVPRADIEAVPVEATTGEVVAAFRKARHTSLIVYRETLDDVLGIVHMKDLLDFWGDGDAFHLEAIVRQVLVVPPSMRVIDLLLEMRDTRMHMAVVVDEFGGIDGLVTIQDIIEELVGELQTEGDTEGASQLVQLPDGTLEADARIDLDELEHALGVVLLPEEERDEADTLAGLIFSLVDRVPKTGEVVAHPNGLSFEVIDADARRIRRVRISKSPTAGTSDREQAAPRG
jgi:magnesium and cobalt transporter